MAGKIILLCGKICSGKTRYAASLRAKAPMLSLSCDELMHALYRHQEGTAFDEISARVKAYLHSKAIEAAQSGADVLLDWGFWTRQERAEVTKMYRDAGLHPEWHYVDVDEDVWRRNIRSRNAACERGETTDYYVDAGLLEKLESRFEIPEPEEMDVWYRNAR